jgi:hypothetical protein
MYSRLDGMRCNLPGAMAMTPVFTPMPFFDGSASVMSVSL